MASVGIVSGIAGCEDGSVSTFTFGFLESVLGSGFLPACPTSGFSVSCLIAKTFGFLFAFGKSVLDFGTI